MRLGIDGTNIRAGGGVTHLVELLAAVNPSMHGIDKVFVWGPFSTLENINDRPWIEKLHEPVFEKHFFQRAVWQYFRLGQEAKLKNCDLLFIPGGSFATNFRPIVTMCRNMLPFEWNELRRYGFTSATLRFIMLRLTQSRSFKKADGLIFLTKYARNTVIEVINDVQGELATIPHGVSNRFNISPCQKRLSVEFTAENPCRIIYVSIIDQYKHQVNVAKAVAKLKAEGFHVILDLIGPSYRPALRKLKHTLKELDSSKEFIRYLGAVDYLKLHEAYKLSDIKVFASSCENMPNILLEAMAASLPIACSDRGPMPEILNAFAEYFNPESVESICQALTNLIISPNLRKKNVDSLYKKVQLYSWDKCAHDTFSFLSYINANYRKKHG